TRTPSKDRKRASATRKVRVDCTDTTSPSVIGPPAVVVPELLPLGDDNLAWKRFEAFCRDLVSRLLGEPAAESYHYGRGGDKQQGIDLVFKLVDGQQLVVQCKQYRQFTGGSFAEV